MRKHYDIEKSRAALTGADAEATRRVLALPGDEDDRRFRLAQSRMSPAKIALRVNLLEALNEGEDPDMTLGALATTVAVVLFNFAEEAERDLGEVVEMFGPLVSDTLAAMVDANDAGESDESDGTFVSSNPVVSAAGRA